MHFKTGKYPIRINRQMLLIGLVFLAQIAVCQTETDLNEGLSSKFTDNYTPQYLQYGSADTTRSLSVKFESFEGRKLIFYDDFIDNRHTWPYWSSLGDSVLQECIGIDNNDICRIQGSHLADSYTDLRDGKKVVACFTPDQMFKYSNQLKLSKNYVVTFNPLSIKQVSKIPSNYYEGFCEHTTRIHKSFDGKNFGIETKIAQAVGDWGLIFGDFDSDKPYYYFKIKTDNSWAFYAVYPNSKSKPIELESGFMPISYQSLEKVNLNLKSNGQGGFKVEFLINDAKAGQANVTRMPMANMDIGYRLDHNSIDGNNIVIANDISVFEQPIETYLEDNLRTTGAWTGKMKRGNNEDLYNVKVYFNEDHSGFITGRFVFEHSKFSDIIITKKFRAKRSKNIINFEETSGTVKGIKNKVLLHSTLLMGNMELYGPDSIIINACLGSNLHRYGEFDNRLNVFSDRIYISRAKKSTIASNSSEYDSINVGKLIEIKRLYFIPNSPDLEQNDETKNSLDNLARELQRYLASYSNTLLLIHGHTDIGIVQTVSLIRAKSIQSELEGRGVETNIFCIGHGSSQRVSAIRGDPRNRRVEVEVLSIDSMWIKDESIMMHKGSKANMINKLPEEYIITAQFRLDPDAKAFVIMEPRAGGEMLKWEIPNVAGGAMQTLKVRKRYKIEEDAIMLEFVLDDVNYLTQSLTGYSTFGFEIKNGTFILDNLVIFGPE